MKTIKLTILSALFFSGLILNANDLDSTKSEEAFIKAIPCETVFVVCDNAHPSDYWAFISCMGANGC